MDVDIVAKVNAFNPAHHSSLIKEDLRKKGFVFRESGNDILLCNYKGMDIDLVLMDARSTSRFADGNENIGSVVEALGDKRDHVCAKMRPD